MGGHNVTVLNWVRCRGQSVKSYAQTEIPIDIRHVDFVEMDEMWHFTVKKSENYGYGSLLIGIPKKSLVSRLEDLQVIVVKKENSWQKIYNTN